MRALPDLEAGFRSVVETASDAVVFFDSHGSILVWNRAAEEMYGCTAEEMVGNWFGDVVAPGLRARFEEALARAAATGVLEHGGRPFESLHVRRDGTEFPVEISVALWNSGDEVFVTTIVRDITERKRVEMDMAQLCSDEKRLREKLEQDIGRNAEFTRALVHELRTPLAAVVASSELLVQESDAGPARSLADIVHSNALNLNDRVGELLDLARGEIGLLRLNHGDVDPAALLQGIVREIGPLALSRRLHLKLEPGPSLPAIRADETRVRQVILNLLDNAFRLTPEGGSITIRARRREDTLILEVEDTGPGMDEEQQKWLFEPRGKRGAGGTRPGCLGIGLPLSKMLVELHGGRLSVRSARGKGSTFTVSLPIDGAAEAGG